MHRIFNTTVALFLGLVLYVSTGYAGIGSASQPPINTDVYPIEDRFAATVIGTPVAYQAILPKTIPIKEYKLASIHPVPEFLWYNDGLRYSVALQNHKAPLVFNIGGTGAAYNSGKMLMLQKALYQAGFHVINLSSPTHINFQVTATQSHLPGYLPEDAEDIYRVMQQTYKQVKDDIEVSEFHVMGYSLGAAHAAFVTVLDQRLKAFDLQKLYMINPPVSLYNSVSILDKMLEDNVEGGALGMGVFLDKAINRLAAAYNPKEGMRFDGDFLYKAYNSWPPSQRGPDAEGRSGAAALIGISFRFTSGAMVFTGDLMSEASYIIPGDEIITQRQSLNYYAQASHAVTFADYVDDMVVPYLKTKHPGKSREDFLRAASLHHIEDFLSSYPQVRVVSNRDEIILAPGELEYMENLLGERMKIFGHGGHCGNINSKENIDDMVTFLTGQPS